MRLLQQCNKASPCITYTHDSKCSLSISHSTQMHIPKFPHCARWSPFPFHHSSHSTHYPLPRLIFHTSHTVDSTDPQCSLHTLSSSSIHASHTPHTVDDPAFSQPRATFSSRIPFAVFIPHNVCQFRTFNTYYSDTFFKPLNAYVDTLARTRQR
ncbi:hypothetical protein AVEN_262109-1 [Araneus ventricosus]|uniref:Uncharacterized protein n=1 Tax=Araneus ventricosus TaxID=182803 RepID=A0A4Y2J7P0_ARAVE|nr:hypothetical protein AVEN_262109-1 [Araneus ventricosus]